MMKDRLRPVPCGKIGRWWVWWTLAEHEMGHDLFAYRVIGRNGREW